MPTGRTGGYLERIERLEKIVTALKAVYACRLGSELDAAHETLAKAVAAP